MAAAPRLYLRAVRPFPNPKRTLFYRSHWSPTNSNECYLINVNSKAYSNAVSSADLSHEATKPLKGVTSLADTLSNIPLKTYNVTKADARPKLSEHHKILFDEKKISVPWEEGKTSHFQHIWIRDHCQCRECFHPETKQRLLDTFSIPKNIKPELVKGTDMGLEILWKNGHKSFFTWEWLHLHSYNPRLERYLSPQFKLWGSEITESLPKVQYELVMNSETGVAEWTRKIVRHPMQHLAYKRELTKKFKHIYGFCYVEGVPANPEATQKLIERIGHIRHTHYGGFWSFTSDLSSKDTAYTNLPLSAHTDTTYFSSPAGLQLFHLLSHIGGIGGQTLLVDGFRAAKILRDEDPTSYRILSNTRVPSHSSGNDGISIQPYSPFPVLNHHPVSGELFQVRWNNDDRATMDRWNDPEDVEGFYDAIRSWNDILKRRESEYWEQLVPGKALVFDNWRVLHGRTRFDGIRTLCGAYISRDDFMSRFMMTNSKKQDVLRAL